ncbi:MAG: sugar O-acyltransferase sialic acid O-acetyltransferase NeuD family [Candidatus Saganbacteria bacterium]|uniref:Sugar O-acyltransferase sialic acid O-acetyltransferase NeuD family n=1 Tax=Candidatus Saganbacteria bacterium TaxID=2575572 RepID=A0A833L2E6_UNCSA|nr:MAG: sugar O-acyltransferase sialic acid O-acetyltransferase NeuD family [Candidatus Saganbacteria bacterium]
MSVMIFGSGGHGKVVLDILLESGILVNGFLDEDEKKIGQIVLGYKVLGGWEQLKKITDPAIALGIGNNVVRERVFRQAKEQRVKIITAVHPRATVSRFASLGEGVVVMPGAVINSGSRLENGVVVNTGASVDHDCQLKEFCQIWPGAHLAGTVTVGKYSYIGTGASVIQNVNIGKNAMIGAGATVISNIPDNVTAVGVPAKVIKERK